MTKSIKVMSVNKSSMVETHGAVDASVTVGEHEYQVTLIPRAWGSERSFWISGPSVDLLALEELQIVVGAVTDAWLS